MRPSRLLLLVALFATSAAAAQPANDAFAAATPILQPGAVAGSNTGATLETGEPVPTCQTSQGASVWWMYTPPAGGLLSVDLGGSSFDTVLSLHQPGTTQIGCNDDVGFPTVTSRVANVAVAGGVPVYIRVAGYRSDAGVTEQGSIALSLSFTTATLVSTPLPPGTTADGPTFAHPADLGTGASGSCRLSTAGTAVPYRALPFTVSVGGAYTVTISDAATEGYDGFLLLYRSPFVPSDPCLNLVAFDDDGTSAPDDAQIAGATLTAGVGYVVVVTGFNNLDFGQYTGDVLGPAAVTFAPVASEPSADAPSAVLGVSPNPARGTARVRFAAETAQDVIVSVFDMTGREVALLFRGAVVGGQDQSFDLLTSALPSGVYVVRATGTDLNLTQRVTVVR